MKKKIRHEFVFNCLFFICFFKRNISKNAIWFSRKNEKREKYVMKNCFLEKNICDIYNIKCILKKKHCPNTERFYEFCYYFESWNVLEKNLVNLFSNNTIKILNLF